MNKNYYTISYSRLALLLLPIDLRRELIIAIVTAMIRPLTSIHSTLMTYISDIDTSMNSQVCYLEALLNDMYDYYERQIVIRDTPIDFDALFYTMRVKER